MAKIIEEQVTVTLSRIAKASDAEATASAITDEMLATIEAVVQELVGDHFVVEVNNG